jgi:aminoglycoside phosphotransferase (APT) family kinase protein
VVAVLDWELATLGHPLADLAYACLIYHGSVFAPGGPLKAGGGIPGEAQFIAAYCRRTGRGAIPNWHYFLAFSLFRAAAILAGVYRRALGGNAADAHARERGAVYREVAELGWSIARAA